MGLPDEPQGLPPAQGVAAGRIKDERVAKQLQRPGEMALPAQRVGERAQGDGLAVLVGALGQQAGCPLQVGEPADTPSRLATSAGWFRQASTIPSPRRSSALRQASSASVCVAYQSSKYPRTV